MHRFLVKRVLLASHHHKPNQSCRSIQQAQPHPGKQVMFTTSSSPILTGLWKTMSALKWKTSVYAWSFPGSGVTVVDFIKNGTVESGGKIYKVEHLHAIRPLRSDREMQTLRNDLPQRVAIWIDNETPYCALRRPNERFCLSCGDFVVRILFPSTNPLSAGLPQDFIRTAGQTPTTDDLLLYMLGMHALPDAKSRLGRLAKLDVPETLRRDLQDLLQVQLADESAAKPSTFTRQNPRIAIRKTQIRRL